LARFGTSIVLNDSDKEVMNVLWEGAEPSYSIHDIFDELNTKRRSGSRAALKFPTLQSALRRLSERGLVTTNKVSRNVQYTAAIQRTEYGMGALREISKEFFGMELSRLIPHLSGPGIKTDADIEEQLKKISELAEK